jgi:hypothetical protein
MKRFIFLCITILLLGGHVFALEEIVLKESESIDFLEKMDQQGVFVKFIESLDIDDENNFYFLDNPLCTVFRIDGRTGRLINTISSHGQGPSELNVPRSIRVINKMVFISDSGFGGVKIFSIDGKLIKEFRTGHSIGWLDVNKKNQIYVREADTDGTPIISIYNMEGKKLRNLIRMPVKNMNDRIDYIFTRDFMFKLDSEDNPVVIFDKKNILRKYNANGEQLWEKKVANKIIDGVPHKTPRLGPEGTVHGSCSIFNLDIDLDDNIIIGHVGGAMVFNKGGEPITIIKTEPQYNMHGLKVFNKNKNLMVIVVGGMNINIYSYIKRR